MEIKKNKRGAMPKVLSEEEWHKVKRLATVALSVGMTLETDEEVREMCSLAQALKGVKPDSDGVDLRAVRGYVQKINLAKEAANLLEESVIPWVKGLPRFSERQEGHKQHAIGALSKAIEMLE